MLVGACDLTGAVEPVSVLAIKSRPGAPAGGGVKRRDGLSRLAAEAGASEPDILARSLNMLLDGAIASAPVSGDADTPQLARRNAELLIACHLG